MPDVANHVLRVRDLLDAQGWLLMMEDHWPAPVVIVREFYMNLHDWDVDSFKTWLRGRPILVTPDLINNIVGVPRVANLDFRWYS